MFRLIHLPRAPWTPRHGLLIIQQQHSPIIRCNSHGNTNAITTDNNTTTTSAAAAALDDARIEALRQAIIKEPEHPPILLANNSDNPQSPSSFSFESLLRGNRIPNNFWSNTANYHRFTEWAARQLGIEKLDDWYNITIQDVRKLSKNMYRGSLLSLLTTAYPDHEWHPWLFKANTPGFWKHEENRRRFMDWAGKQLGVEKLDDWYGVLPDSIRKIGGAQLLAGYYRNSLSRALAALYPEHEWLPWRFVVVPRSFWTDVANHKRFFDWAAKQLGVNHLDDWYNFRAEDVSKLTGGSSVLGSYYGNSLVKALTTLYPEHDWQPWRFPMVPTGFWSDMANHRKFFLWAAQELGIHNRHHHNDNNNNNNNNNNAVEPNNYDGYEGWYNVSVADIQRLGGGQLLAGYYNGSLFQALSAIFPQYEWIPWKFLSVPQGFWTDRTNHRRFFDWAAKQLGVTDLDDWYRVGQEDIAKLGGYSLLVNYYNNSYSAAIAAVYPEREWIPWRFQTVPKGFWADKANHKRFFDWAAKQLGVEKLDDWYNVFAEDVRKIGGTSFFQNGLSLPKALAAAYPEHDWMPWRFRMVSSSIWTEYSMRRRFFAWAAEQLGVQSLDDWYKFTPDHIVKLGGGQLLTEHYGRSLFKALSHMYPEHQWDPWRFRNFRLNNNNNNNSSSSSNEEEAVNTGEIDTNTLRRYIETALAPELHVEKPDDWYRVSVEHARSIRGYFVMVERNGGLLAVLKRLYPNHAWDEDRMRHSRGKRFHQRWLKLAAEKLFPDREVFEEFVHPDLRFEATGTAPITLDVWIPSLQLALEYHGEQHYHDIYAMGDNPSKQRGRDTEKQTLCRNAGITLVAVPYWWDKSMESLAQSIIQQRPELAQQLAVTTTTTTTTAAAAAAAEAADVAAITNKAKQ